MAGAGCIVLGGGFLQANRNTSKPGDQSLVYPAPDGKPFFFAGIWSE